MNFIFSFKDIVLLKSITISIFLFISLSLILVFLVPFNGVILLAIFIMCLSFCIFSLSIYRSVKEVQRELIKINYSLENIDEIDSFKDENCFFHNEFKNIHEQLNDLKKRVKKREAIKKRYNTKLKVKNRQRADMLSAIAHEFRNPISAIMGFSQTLYDDRDIPPTLQEKFLLKINNNCLKIEALLNRLTLWNKIESGDANIYLSSFDIYKLIQETKNSLEYKYKNRNIIIIGEEEKFVKGDRTLIELVLKNLIENGLKYSKDDVFVEIEKETIYIKDKGVGISKDEISKVTKKFYRSSVHTWDNSMGLGLAIVKKILSLHKSELNIQSIEKEGSTFFFSLEKGYKDKRF